LQPSRISFAFLNLKTTSLPLSPTTNNTKTPKNKTDVMLTPIADALRLALDDTAALRAAAGAAPPLIYLAMQGEMSATVMRYPSDWAALAAPLRARVGPKADARVGVGLNFNRLDDTSSTGQDYTSSRVSWLLWSLGVTDFGGGGGRAPAIDAGAVKRLFEGGDVRFVGVSAYAPLTGPGFQLSELENAAFMLAVRFGGWEGGGC
jgi:hypothetical protein